VSRRRMKKGKKEGTHIPFFQERVERRSAVPPSERKKGKVVPARCEKKREKSGSPSLPYDQRNKKKGNALLSMGGKEIKQWPLPLLPNEKKGRKKGKEKATKSYFPEEDKKMNRKKKKKKGRYRPPRQPVGKEEQNLPPKKKKNRDSPPLHQKGKKKKGGGTERYVQAGGVRRGKGGIFTGKKNPPPNRGVKGIIIEEGKRGRESGGEVTFC